MQNKDLKKRILQISFDHKLSHIGSNLTAVDIIEEIYACKKPEEKFILSSGHAGLALYCVIEKHEGVNAETIFKHHGVHPDRCSECHLYCSTGSLGHGLGIAVGIALADRTKNVYCLISDGECAEGSIFEATGIIRRQNVTNIKVYINVNGYSAYQKTDKYQFPASIGKIVRTTSEQLSFLKGLDAHYHVMTDEEYKQTMEVLK